MTAELPTDTNNLEASYGYLLGDVGPHPTPTKAADVPVAPVEAAPGRVADHGTELRAALGWLRLFADTTGNQPEN